MRLEIWGKTSRLYSVFSIWCISHQKKMKRIQPLAVWQPLIANFIRSYGRVQQEFGGPKGHTCDLMALDSNAMTGQDGSLASHLTPHPSPQSCDVNFFAQDLSSGAPFLAYPYVFPPLSLMVTVLHFLRSHGRSCTVIALNVYPRKYWWPLIQSCAIKSCRLAVKGEAGALMLSSKQGWIPHPGIPGDLTAFGVLY